MPWSDRWRDLETNGPDGAGGLVWVWYPNPHHPQGGNMRVQGTPVQQEMAVKPTLWHPVSRPAPPRPLASGEALPVLPVVRPLSVPQRDVLEQLARMQGPVWRGVFHGTVVNWLERHGLVERCGEHGATDKIRLTEAGRNSVLGRT